MMTSRALSVPLSASLSTCTITTPPEFLAACAMASASRTMASFSMVMLPSGSAVVPAQEGHMDGEGLVEEIVLAIDIHHRDKIFSLGFGQFVELAAIDPGIDKGAEADMGQISRLAGGDVSIELSHSSHGNVVGENLVVVDQFPQPWGKTRMAADDSSHQAFKGKVIQPLVFSRPPGPPDTSASNFSACRFSGIAP